MYNSNKVHVITSIDAFHHQDQFPRYNNVERIRSKGQIKQRHSRWQNYVLATRGEQSPCIPTFF